MLDSCPNELRDGEEYLELVDTAFFINTSCPPLLRPERKVDVILHLNYSGGSQLLVRLFFGNLSTVADGFFINFSLVNIKRSGFQKLEQ